MAALEVTSVRFPSARCGPVTGRQSSVTRPMRLDVRRLVRLRHAAVGVAPVSDVLRDAGVLGEVLTDAVGYVLGGLTDIDNLLFIVSEFVHAGHGVAASRRGKRVKLAPAGANGHVLEGPGQGSRIEA